MSLPYAYYAATLCKKLEQTYERILRSKMYTRTEANLKVPTASGGGPKRFTLLGQNMQEILTLNNFGPFLHNMTPWKGTQIGHIWHNDK